MESTLGADFSGVKIHPNSSKAPAVGGLPVNDDPGLEKEADQMGKKASSR